MLREYGRVRKTLREAVAQHEHLCFTFGGIIGDWPALAAREAIRQDRRYGAWIDRVEVPIIRNRMAGASQGRRLAAAIAAPLGEHYTRHLIRHSAVALLQGGDTFQHYARWASAPHCTYDTHTRIHDRIDAATVSAKQARLVAGEPLRIVYAGRAAPMKGTGDWLDTLALLHAQQIPFRATWIGDGPDLATMRGRVASARLTGLVDLPGFEGDRDILLDRMRQSDMLLFCHKTPESARCLIEALVSGCPLVGYRSAYAYGLVATHGGGAFTPLDDPNALAVQVAELHRDRAGFARLIGDAAASGRLYDEDGVYAHRAELMRRA
ncbi:glycosyltransferase [Sphingomonas abietis]|uniref:Glycosyltransferase n=1 Tax=Sphingomonas abietis TaxID=3012344 RepID=A0ABY7NMX3_9SPHN|nr:glycosyltransferase [Sphingomonas abietis]WBO20856.1 glycosyltransferase [Sphingomonas abietis]